MLHETCLEENTGETGRRRLEKGLSRSIGPSTWSDGSADVGVFPLLQGQQAAPKTDLPQPLITAQTMNNC